MKGLGEYSNEDSSLPGHDAVVESYRCFGGARYLRNVGTYLPLNIASYLRQHHIENISNYQSVERLLFLTNYHFSFC